MDRRALGRGARGAVLVPIDYRASADYLKRIAEKVSARVVLVGQEVDRAGARRRRFRSGRSPSSRQEPDRTPSNPIEPPRTHRTRSNPTDVAEIIFTSGATADPKGVVITHRNILANIVPIEREVLKYRKYGAAVPARSGF